MKITAIRRRKGSRNRLNVYVDGEFRLSVAEDVVASVGLRQEAIVTDVQLRILESEDMAWRVRDRAIRLLTHRARGTVELKRRLIRAEFPREAVDACITELARKGLLNDGEFARSFAREALRGKPRSRRRIALELRGRGVAPEVVEEALADVFSEVTVSEVDLARLAARKFRQRKGEEPRNQSRRLFAFLVRRGFSPESIHQIIDEQPN